ncbi:Sir2 family NAD-dependent protein deacetylase [Sphingomonas montana]|uniref:Sir2 family NAD-dependent protein deacetylase n=1 Tax=Sphingomonas montana TaxID=1843236 RepID=UPI00096BF53C|nr:Sir2 family NAD-dependent protein deacetylase [Sphingomonas montana]
MRGICNIVVLTGAGLSAESGIPTFRTVGGVNYWDTGDGTAYTIEEVCTPEALERDERLVQAFYDGRRAALDHVVPNAAHRALARLAAEWNGGLTIVTQNVDDLLERAGLPVDRVWHMHGTLRSALCRACGGRIAWEGALVDGPPCPVCGAAALRPDIVFFGEMPHHMDAIEAALADADLFVSIGTSGAVYPAAGFVQTARHYGARTLELNLDPSAGSIFFDETRLGPAGLLVPDWVDAMLAVGALR